MKNPLVVIKKMINSFGKSELDKQMIQSREDLKNRVLKNNEVVLEALGTVIEGGKQCPHLVGNKCIGKACQYFTSWNIPVGIDEETKQIKYQEVWRCVVVEQSLLTVETNNYLRAITNNLAETNSLLKQLLERK